MNDHNRFVVSYGWRFYHHIVSDGVHFNIFFQDNVAMIRSNLKKCLETKIETRLSIN